MPNFKAPEFELDFSRKALLIDTCVIYAAFSDRDQRKESAEAFLDLWDGDILVTVAVVVETWGMLVGSDNNWSGGFAFVSWLQNPGNRIFLIPQNVNDFDRTYGKWTKLHVDCVDVFLMRAADEITSQCSFNPFIKIATYDFSDFVRGRDLKDMRFNLINPDTLDEYP
jgi:hypothetical protein